MQDQVSLVRYFADVRKLVTMCYKLSLEKQELCNQLNKNKNKKIKFNHSFRENESDSNDNNEHSRTYSESRINVNQEQKEQKPKQSKKKVRANGKTRSGSKLNKKESQIKSQRPKEIWPCQHCDKQYKHLTSLKRHVSTDHQSNNNIVLQVDS